MATIKKKIIKIVGKNVAQLAPLCIGSGNVCKRMPPLENSVVAPQKLSIKFSYDPEIPLLCTCPPKLKAETQTIAHQYL